MEAGYRSPELLRALFAKTATPMLLVDDQRRYIDANPAACRLLRCDREWLIGMRIDDLAAENVAGVPELWATFLQEGTQSGRFNIKRADSSQVEVSYSATARITPGVHLSVLVPAGDEDELDAETEEGLVQAARSRLTQREREVMTLLALGTTAPEIADNLVISKETVRNHTRNAREKLGARTRAQAIAVALDRGEIEI